MAIELKVPAVGESISEVQIGEWLKKEGEAIKADETLVMIDTEKTTVELPSPSSGVLGKILKQSGEIARVGEVIAHLEEGASALTAPSSQSTATPDAVPADSPAPEWEGNGGKISASVPTEGTGGTIEPQNATSQNATSQNAAASAPDTSSLNASESATRGGLNAQVQSSNQDQIAAGQSNFVMPAAQHALQQNGLDAQAVTASGPNNRLLKEDVLAHVEKAQAAAQSAPQSTLTASVPTQTTAPIAEAVVAGEDEEVVPMTMLRRRVAEHLVKAQQEAALLTTFNEIDMTQVMALRKEHQDAFTKKYGIKLGFMSFFIKASIDALKLYPGINAELRGTNILYRNHYDIGVAIGGGKGLVVPVLRRAERMSFAEIEVGIAEYAKRAKENTLKPDELMGGTFTITNGGIYGSLLSTPIVNAPQSGILGMHAIQERPVARNGQVVIAPMMYVALTYDHRIVDGREAVSFLVRVKECIENPSRMLIEA